MACAELELDCSYFYPAGRDPHLPLRRQGACTKLQLDCSCYYPAGRVHCLPLRRQGACAELQLDCSYYYAAGLGLHLPSCRQVACSAVRGAGAGLLLLLPCWTRSAPSFAPPGGVRGAEAVATTTPLDEILTILRAARGRAQSFSWTAVATTTLLDEVRAFLKFTPLGGVHGAGAGLLLLLPC